MALPKGERAFPKGEVALFKGGVALPRGDVALPKGEMARCGGVREATAVSALLSTETWEGKKEGCGNSMLQLGFVEIRGF